MSKELGDYQTLLELEVEEPELQIGAEPLRFGFVQTPDALTIEDGRGVEHHFRDGLVDLKTQGRKASLYAGSGGMGGASFVVATDAFPFKDLRRRGVRFQRIRGKVWWWRPGQKLSESEAFLLWRGELRNPIVSPDGSTFAASLSAATRERDAAFPPGFIGDEGRFPPPLLLDPPESSLSQPMQVVYGAPDDVPVYPVSDDTIGIGTVRYLLAGHRVRGFEPTNGVLLQKNLGAVAGDSTVETVEYAVDGRGQTYSYADVDATKVTGDDSWVAKGLTGYVSASRKKITRLGDVLRHIVLTYAKESFFELDHQRIGGATTQLNRYEFSGVFNQPQQISILRVLRSRFESQYPVVFGFANGKFGWDYVGVPSGHRPVAEIIFGQNAHSRGTFIPETPIGLVRSRFEVLYGNSGMAAGTTKARRIDETNNAAARGAFLKWGQSPTERLSVPDIEGGDTAFLIAEDSIRRLAGVRQQISYTVADPTFLRLPMFGRVFVTDAKYDWEQEPMLIEGLTPSTPGLVMVDLITERLV